MVAPHARPRWEGRARLAHAFANAAASTLQQIDLVAGLKNYRDKRNGRHDELFRAGVYSSTGHGGDLNLYSLYDMYDMHSHSRGVTHMRTRTDVLSPYLGGCLLGIVACKHGQDPDSRSD